MVTGMPADRKFMLIPPPIVPAPITPTRLIGRSGVFGSTSSILAAWRSAKKMWRWAADCTPVISFMNSSRSNFMPSSKGSSVAATAQRMFASGASKPRNFFALALRNSATASGSGFASLSRMRGIGRLRAISRAKAIASASRLSSPTTRSIRPSSAAFFAGTGSPIASIGSDAFIPIRRGRRCVPPAPGSRPSFTSGVPIIAEGTATR